MKNIFHHFLFTSAVIIMTSLNGCTPYTQVSTENIAPSYQENYEPLCKSVYVVHRNDSLSEFLMEMDSNAFLYIREKPMEPFKASATIRIAIFDSYSERECTDSTSMNIRFEKDSLTSGLLSYSLPMKIKTGRTCIAYISVLDNNKETRQTILVQIDKVSHYSQQWFKPMKNISRIPEGFFCTTGTKLVLSYNGENTHEMKCLFFSDSFPIPTPPYALENVIEQTLKEDAVIPVEFLSDGKSFSVLTAGYGMYYFTSDPEMRNGFTVICAKNGFPDVNSHEAMMNPIRYISTQKEFKRMAETENKIAAIEDFWLKIGVQEDHTRNLIRKYYSRVMYANRLFTSFTEGWQTDRGMIYIVFGPPNIVYRSDENELWIYGEENNFFSIVFTFEKMNNKFSNNDYSLQRTPICKDNWFRAVEIWRQ